MKLIPIETSKTHNTGRKAAPAGVSVNGNTFALNNLAIMELSKIWGGMGFALQIYVSECGNYVAFSPKQSEVELTGQPKAIVSGLARERLNFTDFRKSDIVLHLDNDVLVGKVN